MRSVAADEVAVTMAHSTGQGTSTPFSVSAFDASDTATPSFTSAAACARFAGVTRLSVPSSSSLPQRPQLESSVCQRSYSALSRVVETMAAERASLRHEDHAAGHDEHQHRTSQRQLSHRSSCMVTRRDYSLVHKAVARL